MTDKISKEEAAKLCALARKAGYRLGRCGKFANIDLYALRPLVDGEGSNYGPLPLVDIIDLLVEFQS